MASNFWEGNFYFDNVFSSTYGVCIVDINSNEILKQVGLEHKINSKVKHLSGGEKQRVAIARVLAKNYYILLYSKEDDLSRNEASSCGILKKIYKQSKTVLEKKRVIC